MTSGGIWLPGTSARAAQVTPTLTAAQRAADADDVQRWLGGKYPHLAELCDAAPGLAAVFADVIEGLIAFCGSRDLDPATLNLSARIEGTSVMIDLGL